MAEPQRQHENNRSSIFEKVPPTLRDEVDLAIIRRSPPTFAAAYQEHQLWNYGVSYTAFYRYARRLRDQANLASMADLTSAAAENGQIEDSIRALLARQVFDTLLNDGASPRDLASLLSSLRGLTRAALLDRMQNENSRLAWARLEHEKTQFRLKAESDRQTQRRLLNIFNRAEEFDEVAEAKAPKPALPAAKARPDRALVREAPRLDSLRDPATPDPNPAGHDPAQSEIMTRDMSGAQPASPQPGRLPPKHVESHL